MSEITAATSPGRAGTALAVALCALVAALALAPPGAAKPSDKELAQSLAAELAEQGIQVGNVSSCRPKRGGDVYVCKWRAEGFFPGEVPYLCAGRSKYRVKSNSWKIGGCHNRLEPQVPLLAEPGPHPQFGFNEDWHANVGKLDELAVTGANVARTGLYWEAVDHSGWGTFDSMYQQMLVRGIRPLWVIQAAPCWAQGNNCKQGSHPSAEHYDEFASFAAQAAQRYPQALGIEVWNEPNWKVYWGGDPDPQAYGRMVAEVAPAVRAANPGMTVVTAGLSPHINSEKDAMAYKKFLRRAYATGGPQLADAIGAHPYPNRLYGQDFLGNVRTHLFRYQAVMNQNGDGATPIWVTETGISTTGKEAFTEEHQAEGLARIYTQFRRIANVPVVVFHRFVDQPSSAKDNERGYGVLNGGGGRKLAYCAVAAARGAGCG
jgi:polysaccharide biosynthesis protein PslG